MLNLNHRLKPPRLPGNASLALFPLLLATLLFLAACSGGKSETAPQAPPVPVAVAPVVVKNMPVAVKTIGNVEAYSAVSIRARVGGELKQVHFQEGQEVKKGDLLFVIDPRPFEATLKEARAKQARDQALLKKAQDDARRYGRLIQDDLISREQYDQVVANSEALAATVKADEAAVENARLQVEYCHIHAPLSGRTGSLLIHPGNLIKADDEKKFMAVIHQIQPIYVSFALPERYFPDLKKALAASIPVVQAVIAGEEANPVQGRLTFVDNTVDLATGTIRLKATFENAHKRLWPGQFVEVSLQLAEQPNALVVPAQAVQTGQNEQYVFVVKPDHTVEYRPVTVSRTQDGETIIAQGVSPGETVVTDGHLRLSPGSRVVIKEAPGTSEKVS